MLIFHGESELVSPYFFCNGMISNTEYIRLLSELRTQFSITFPFDSFSMIQHGDLMEKPGVISQRSGPQGDTICTRIYKQMEP